MRRLVPALAVVGLAPLLACRTDPPPPPPAPTEPVHFAWPAPLSVPVDEAVTKGDGGMQARYVIDICPASRGGRFIVHRDFRVIGVEGIPSVRDASPDELLSIPGAALPTLVVDAQGAYVGMTGLRELVDRFARHFPAADVAPLRELAVDPQKRALVEGQLVDRWRSWTQVWLGFDPAKGSPQDVTVAMAGGTQTWRVSFVAPGGAGRVTLEARRDVDGAEERMTVETDWPNVRPWRVRTQTPASSTEYRFDWEGAVGGASHCHDAGDGG